MRTLQDFSPRRYYVDKEARRVLVGLTMEETVEFEQLDRLDPLDKTASNVAGSFGETAIVSGKKRWLELYMKHDDAWKSWMAESKQRRVKDLWDLDEVFTTSVLAPNHRDRMRRR